MQEFLRDLFTGGNYAPHIECYLRTPGLVWTHALSDLLIGLAYVAISATLVHFVRRGRRDIAFHGIFLAFGLFIVACGGTHFMEIVTLWQPVYWLSGGVKVVTAGASVFTAMALPPLLAPALAMIREARLSQTRQQELEATHAELSQVHARLKELDELRTQFFANVSHELRTPLTLILGPADRLQRGALTQEQREDLEAISRNARVLLKHVDDMLDVARMDAARMDLHPAPMDLASLVRLAAANFDGVAREREMEYRVWVPDTLPVMADWDKLERVVVNLVSNAFKFTPDRGVIHVTLDQGPEGVVLWVADSGPGIPEAMREAVFERFRQIDGGSTRRHGGTGLGLAIARDFTVLHQGRLTVSRSPLGGALFRADLPLPPAEPSLLEAPLAGDAGRSAADELVVRDALRLPETEEAEAATVLVVEDNPEMLRFISDTLEPEFRTVLARDGEEGMARLRERTPDLILSDVMMPRVSGEALLQEVRRSPEWDDLPVMLLTARTEETFRIRLLNEGAQDYLTKPFAAAELQVRVRNLITARRAIQVLRRELSSSGTDLEQLARELAARKRELEETLAAVDTALDAAERANGVKTTFLRLVSHELRTPLTALQLQVDLFLRQAEGLTPKQQQGLKRMDVATKRLVELVESLLEHTRLESGQVELRRESVDGAALVHTVLDEMRSQAEQKQLSLASEVEEGVPPFNTDPRLLRLILVNLVGNAIKFTQQGTITVGLQWRDEAHRLWVRDQGPGISEADRVRIFDAFTQLEPLQRKSLPGVGLGLSLVREMLEALGGSIELSSRLGEGSTFTAILPTSPQAENLESNHAGHLHSSPAADGLVS